MSTWHLNTPLKQVVAHSAGITFALTAGMNIDEPTVAFIWLIGAVIAEYTASQYNEINAVNGGWQKFIYIVSWFLAVLYSAAFIGGVLVGIVGSAV